MLPAAPTASEPQRLAAVRRTGLLDAAPQDALDRITRRASQHFGVPIALISLVDKDRQFFASRCGLDAKETPRDVSFCGHAIHAPGTTLVVEDAPSDPRFFDNPLVTGEPHVVFYAGRPLCDRGGNPLGSLCVIDHTPRSWDRVDDETLGELARWAELELHALSGTGTDTHAAVSRAHFFDTSQDIFAVAKLDGTLLDANNRMVEQLGYPKHAMLGRPIFDVIHPLDDAASRVFLHSVAEAGQSGPFINRIRRADGAFRAMEWTCSTHDGLVYAAARDVTAREQQALHLRTTNKALASSNRDLRDFASFTAHELRAPLRTIAGFVGIIERKAQQDEQLTEAAQRVVRGTRRMDQLIQDMLQLASINSDVTPHEPVNLDELSESVNRTVQQAYPDVKILWDDTPPVLGNASQLHQLFLNIIENGAKYHPKKRSPVVRVSCEYRRGRIQFVVSDNGIGIPPGLATDIFEPFRRGHSQDEYEGTGIGLAMCKKIVQRHGGRIQAHGDSGHGSTFTFDLPAFQARAPPQAKQPSVQRLPAPMPPTPTPGRARPTGA